MLLEITDSECIKFWGLCYVITSFVYKCSKLDEKKPNNEIFIDNVYTSACVTFIDPAPLFVCEITCGHVFSQCRCLEFKLVANIRKSEDFT